MSNVNTNNRTSDPPHKHNPTGIDTQKKLRESDQFLTNHMVNEKGIYPAAAYLELILEMIRDNDLLWEKQPYKKIVNVFWKQPLDLDEGEIEKNISIHLQQDKGGYDFQISSPGQGVTLIHASGTLLPAVNETIDETEPGSLNLEQISSEFPVRIEQTGIYPFFKEIGITYEGLFQCLNEIKIKEDSALAKIMVEPGSDYILHPGIVDGIIQTILMVLFKARQGAGVFVPFSVREIIIRKTHLPAISYAYATGIDFNPDREWARFDALLLDEQENVLIEIKDICMKAFPNANPDKNIGEEIPGNKVVIAASFTAEPIKDALSFWLDRMQLDAEILFAPYNQIFQELLNSGSLSSTNRRGINILMLRLEDFAGPIKKDIPAISPGEKDKYLAGKERYVLPNNLEIAHLNTYETQYLYNEIFLEKTYLKKGIEIHDGDVVIDIGANIGMFSLFVAWNFQDVKIYSFDPSPVTFEVLQANLQLYAPDSAACNFGISGENTQAEFTFYPNSSVFSGFHAHDSLDEKAITAVIENVLVQKNRITDKETVKLYARQLMESRLQKQTYTCELKTLSTVMRELQIHRVDLLKVDAEKSEWDILTGINEQDWEKIKQIVIEVHDEQGTRLTDIKNLLMKNGFTLEVVEEKLLESSGLFNIYAKRPGAATSVPAPKSRYRENIETNMNDLLDILKSSARKIDTPYMVCLCPESPETGFSPDKTFISRMEDMIARQCQDIPNIYVLNIRDFKSHYPFENYYDIHRDRMAHIPYTPEFYTTMATVLARRIYGLNRTPYKVIALDCDNTLWKGVCGEVGARGVEITPAFQYLQRFMVKQHDSGVLICLVSKNQEEDVKTVFNEREDMILKWDHITAAKINWQPKSSNIQALARELNLGIDSFIFIDDNPVEGAEVKANCPDVLTLQLPQEHKIKQFLDHIWAFDHWEITETDRKRTELYKQEQERKSFQATTLNFKDFIEKLALDIRITPVESSHYSRVSELSIRTNQFNFTTMRRKEPEIKALLETGNMSGYVAYVSDRFGDYGLVGLLIVKEEKKELLVDTFLLSCRVLGRGVEHRFLAEAGKLAAQKGKKHVVVRYIPTEKNEPAKNFLLKVGAAYQTEMPGEIRFTFPTRFLEKLVFVPPESQQIEKKEDNQEIKDNKEKKKDGPGKIQAAANPDQSLFFNELTVTLRKPGDIIKEIVKHRQDKNREDNPSEPMAASESRQYPAGAGDITGVKYFIKNIILRGLTRALQVDESQLNLERSFRELGIDSMTGITLIAQLNSTFDVILSITVLYDYPRLDDLVEYLTVNYKEAVKKQFRLYQSGDSSFSQPVEEKLDTAVTPFPSGEISADATRRAPGRDTNLENRDVAVIGMAGRFPGAPDMERFWKLLSEGRSGITEVPADRWSIEEFYDPDPAKPNKSYCKWGGFLEDIDRFDPLFFNISGKEAIQMDPQQRLFLEESWKALEDAGYANHSIANTKCGVFVGAGESLYQVKMRDLGIDVEAPVFTGNHPAVLASRLSYFLDLKGPSMVIDTACSSSLAAVHVACESIFSGHCDLALAGGVFINTTPDFFIRASKTMMLSPAGTCKTFDEAADGFVPGEGVGVVVLKPLASARQDGDHVYGIIKGSSLNQDGKTNGIMAPSALSQTQLELDTYKRAGIDPALISYVEAHGTGTKLGDPIEVKAISDAFRRSTDKKQFCALGSVKTNIGHAINAAGIAGLIKVLLCLKHKKLVPSLHLNQENQFIDFKNSPFFVNTELSNWSTENSHPCLAAVSSFGFSGTNCHMVVAGCDEKRQPPLNKEPDPVISVISPVIFILSAKNKERLKEYAGKYANYIEPGSPSPTLTDIAYTLQVGRQAQEERLALVVNDKHQLKERLKQFCQGETEIPHLYQGNATHNKKVSELFLGGRAGEEFTRILVNQKDFDRLAQLWVLGVDMDWRLLYPHPRQGSRIPLPTYPFARERYWIAEPKDRKRIEPATRSSQILYFSEEWQETGRHATLPLSLAGVADGECLILFDVNNNLAQALLSQLQKEKKNNVSLILVKPGNRFQDMGNGEFIIDPGSMEDYQQLFASLADLALSPVKILHLWSQGGFNENETLLTYQLTISIYSVFYMTRALMNRKPRGYIRLLYIFPYVEDESQPQYAAVSGFARTLRLENPNFICKCLALQTSPGVPMTSPPFLSRNLPWLTYEFQAETDDSIEICLAGGKRYIKQFKEVQARPVNEYGKNDEISALTDNAMPWLQGGVYLITGGTGGLGLILAEYLAKKIKKKTKATLVLVDCLRLEADKQEKIQALASLGASVHYIQADISRQEEVRCTVTEARSRFGPLTGIIHCAGAIRDAFIIKKTPADLQAVLAAKVQGTIYLDEETRHDKLNFFMMFSSIVSVLGNVGQCDYAYANRFLDHFARKREHLRKHGERSGRSIALNWPLWQDGGLPVSREYQEAFQSHSGTEPLPTEDGIKVLETCFQYNQPQLIVMSGHAPTIKEKLLSPVQNTISDTVSDTTFADDTIHPLAVAPISGNQTSDQLRTRILEYLRNLFSELLKLPLEKIQPQVRFEEYGFDSLLVNEFNRMIETELGPLPKTLLFEYQNLDELTGYFIENPPSRLQDRFTRTHTHSEKEPASGEPGSGYTIPNTGRPDRNSQFSPGNNSGTGDIAIIGISGRYPQAPNLDRFWKNLESGKDCITDIPADRWDFRQYMDPDPARSSQGKIYCHWGGFLSEVDKFDPDFFNISPREAEMLDPQERLFLETAWETLEDAGYTGQRLNGYTSNNKKRDIGVFVGITTYDYILLAAAQWHKGNMVIPKTFPWSIANRVSFCFNFHGPSMPVDTGCSSSLTAIYLAGESIKKGECSMALAGGVNLYFHPSKYIHMCAMRMLSPTGRCHTFGADSDGFVPGEGVGAVLLKSLHQAIQDGDRIYGVIKGGAINHGGRTNGYTVPNPKAQADLIRAALENAGLDARTISYIEAHGTGTSLGDPIEIEGITRAFNDFTAEKKYCAVGSVKSNIGHLESAAGIAGLTKVLLQMKHKRLVPSLYADVLNPNINFDESQVYVQKSVTPWTPPFNTPRRAGLSSFGAGGTNVHLILEEYDASPPEYPSAHIASKKQPSRIIGLSARNNVQLSEYVKKMVAFLEEIDNHPTSSVDQQPGARDVLMHLQKDIRAVAAEIIAVQETDVDVSADLTEFGFDAVNATQLINRVNQQYRLEITPAVFDRHFSIAAIADYLYENVPEVRNGHPGDNAAGVPRYLTLELDDIGYTLQAGREPMAERLALIVSDTRELYERLKDFNKGEPASETLYRGNAIKGKLDADIGLEARPGEEHIHHLIITNNVTQLARLWVSGVEIDWESVYTRQPQQQRPRIISLPTYPFEKHRCWFDSYQEPSISPVAVPTTSSVPERLTLKLKNTHRPEQEQRREAPVKLEFPYREDIAGEQPDIKPTATLTSDIDQDMLRSQIKKRLAEVLHMKPTGIDDNKSFVDMGLDSVLAVELVNRFNHEFHASIRATKLYDYPTVNELTAYIASLIKENSAAVSFKTLIPVPGNLGLIEPGSGITQAPPEAVPGKLINLKQINLKPGPSEPAAAVRDIAIIGMSARYPGARDIWEFWKILSDGICTVREINGERWPLEGFYDPNPTAENRCYCKWGGFLDDIDQFDSLFFSISPAEAAQLDPQQRIFLQEAWRALENAGFSPDNLSNKKCGVYVGVMGTNEYNPGYLFNYSSILAARIAYFLNLKGPAISIDTACSSSLIAIHLACKSLLEGETEMMLAGGVTLYLREKSYLEMSRSRMVSPEGKCKTFDNSADGFVPAEGVGVVVLKLMANALRDGDHIYGVIKGSGINQDGKTNGITAPSANSQRDLELEVYKKNNINPETITFVEAHGTGTLLGDPIEVEALTEAFGHYTQKKQYCALGSVKTNLGHTSAAAGVAGVIKVLLALKHKKIPPSLHFNHPNRHIDFENSPFFVNTTLKDWTVPQNQPRRAAVSSFGYSGTNAHLVIQEAPQQHQESRSGLKPYYLIPLSAKTRETLHRKIIDLKKWLEHESGQYSISDISYTLLIARSHFPLRLALVVRDTGELKQKLDSLSLQETGINVSEPINPPDKIEEQIPVLSRDSAFDERGRQLMAQLQDPAGLEEKVYKEKIAALADLYMKGYNTDWQLLFQNEDCQRVPMPMYPFEKRRHWMPRPWPGSTVETQPIPWSPTDAGIQLQEKARTLITQILSQRRNMTDIEPDGSKKKKPVPRGIKLTLRTPTAGMNTGKGEARELSANPSDKSPMES